jgi:hypothetical protein
MPALAARLDDRQGDPFGQESQPLAAAATEAIFEIDDIAAALADEKLQNISSRLIKPRPTQTRSRHRRFPGVFQELCISRTATNSQSWPDM